MVFWDVRVDLSSFRISHVIAGWPSGEEKECPRFASYPQYSGFVLVVLKLSIPAGEIM